MWLPDSEFWVRPPTEDENNTIEEFVDIHWSFFYWACYKCRLSLHYIWQGRVWQWYRWTWITDFFDDKGTIFTAAHCLYNRLGFADQHYICFTLGMKSLNEESPFRTFTGIEGTAKWPKDFAIVRLEKAFQEKDNKFCHGWRFGTANTMLNLTVWNWQL